MRTEAPLDLVVYNLPRLRSPLESLALGTGSLSSGKSHPSFQHCFTNCTSISRLLRLKMLCFTHLLLESRPTIFVEGSFLVSNHAYNGFPFFSSSSSSSQRLGGALHEVAILVVLIQGPYPPYQSIACFSLGFHLLLLLYLYNRFPWPLPSLFCFNFL